VGSGKKETSIRGRETEKRRGGRSFQKAPGGKETIER